MEVAQCSLPFPSLVEEIFLVVIIILAENRRTCTLQLLDTPDIPKFRQQLVETVRDTMMIPRACKSRQRERSRGIRSVRWTVKKFQF